MRKFYFLLLAVLFAAIANAQISNYSFSQSSGVYTPITGGTVIVSATDPLPAGLDSACMDDFTYAEYALPFPFYYGTGNQTSFRVNSNGWLGFGTGNTTNSTAAISSTLPFNGIVSPFSSDLLGLAHTSGTVTSASNTITAVANTGLVVIGAPITGTGIPAGTTITGFTATTITMSANATATTAATFISWCTGEIRANTIGVAPNRTFVIQFTGLSQYSTTTTSAGLNSIINFQIRLAEGGGVAGNQTVSIVYGAAQHPGTSTTGQVGLRGTVNTDFNNRTTTTDWSATTAGATNTASVTWGAAINPASGLTFTWTPPPACAIPTSQPTALVLTPTAGAINGSFTAAAGAPTGYLVVRTTSAAAPANPVDGTNYTPGSSALGGLIIASGAPTTFSSGNLSPSTTYYYWVYSFNNTLCTGGPVYRIASPLTGNATTLACTVTGNKTVGPTGNYPTLTAALADITTNGLAGPVILELQPTYTSGGETFPITIGALPCPVNGLTIRPQTGASGLVITSANATATIDLNGATNVTIDGRPGGTGVTSQLTITNTATGTASDIRFINDASNNIVTYTSLLGSSSTTNGVVLFSTGSVTGNDGNTISNNTISAAGANLPLNGVVSLGTSTAIDNSGNTVTGNNIADVFNAGSVYNGINLGTGNSNWTITNNRIYQTAARTVTTANTVNGINITSGNNYTITGNVIGYASPAGTGIMTLNSAAALRFIGINGTFTAGNTNSIQGNTIGGIAMTTTASTTTANGIWAGINVTSGNVNIGTVTGNTIGENTGTGSVTTNSTVTGGLLVGINSSSTGVVSIQNNVIGSLTNTGTTAAIAGSVTGINVSGIAAAMTINGNTIGNNTANNIRGGTAALTTGSSLVSGINLPSTPGAVTINNNTIQNLASYGSGTTGFVRGIWTAAVTGSGTVFTVMGNSINSLTTDATLTTIANGQGSAVGINLGVGFNSLITQNIIHTISNSNTTATGNFVAGIIHANATNSTISRNRIYNISNLGTSTTAATPSIAAGIINRSGTNFTTIANNMISLGNGQTNNTSFLGIMLNHGSTPDPLNNIFFNSVNIEGAVAAGAQPTFGIARTDFSTTAKLAPVDIRNNIITNSRSGGTGPHFAIANNYGAVAASAVGWGMNASNFNVLNANAATIGWWTSNQTFAGWKTASNSDPNSFSNITVNYVNTALGDLHLNMGVTPTPLESGGTTGTGITNDYDNQTRPGPAGSVNGGALAPDLGADEFDGVPQDIAGPFIVYTPLANTLCNAARTLTATIIDISGINTAPGTRPRVYYKKSTNANVLPGTNTNTTDGWKWVEATNTTNPFTFNIDPSLIFGGVAAGDIIQYFVVAQDMAGTPNVSINSGSFTGTPTSVNLAAGNFPITGTINSYTVGTGGLSGTVTIGAAGTYPSLTGAGGLFAAINGSGLSGNLTANIIDASVTETGTNALNQMVYGCAGPYSLIIKPGSGVTSTLTGSLASNALIRILSSNVTVDGSNNGSTSRDLTLTNTNTTAPSVFLFGSTGTTPVTNSTLKNSIAINGANTATAVVVSDAALGAAGYFNNITIQNNSIQRAYIGIYNIAVPVAGNGSGLLVTGNDLSTSGANSIRLAGIYVQGVDGVTVSNNTIGNIANTLDAANITGIWFATSTINGTISGNTINSISSTLGSTTGPRGIVVSSGLPNANINIANNTITGISNTSTGTSTAIHLFSTTSGVTIQKNQIRDIKNSNATGFGANGIQLSSTLVAANVNVNNNFISDVAASGFNGSAVGDNGYGIILTSGGGYNVDFNTVLLNTNQLTGVGLPAAININAAVNTPGSVNIRNNIFANTQTLGTNRYSIFSAAPNTTFGVIDFNDYYSAGPNLGNIDGVDRSNLAAIRTGFGQNLNSISFLPTFVSATDLHLSTAAGANWCLDGSATPLPGVTTDIDNQVRSVGTPPNGPDMGADEFNATGLVITNPAAICPGSTANLTAAAITAGSIAGLTFTYFTDAAATIPVATPTAVGGGTYYIKASNGTCFLVRPVVVSLLPSPTAFNVTGGGSYCVTGTGVPIGLSGSQTGVNYQLVLNGTTNIGAPVAGTNAAISFGLQTSSGTYTVVATNTTTTCTSTMTGSVPVLAFTPPVITGVLTQPTTCLSADGAIAITLSGNLGTGFSIIWTGPGVNQATISQTNLTVGTYTLQVDVVPGGCRAIATFILTGPGGCGGCPTVPTLTTNPTPTVCAGSNVTLAASGLTGMGTTYGITFKQSTVALANPYTGGTVITTIPNAGLTGGGTGATTTAPFATAGSYFIYAVLSPTPVDPSCRPSAVANLTVNPIPTVNTVTNQTVCNGASTTATTFTGAVAGTVYNWTNNTTSIGLGASGSGNIPSFVATNAGTTPVTATITVTPSYTNAGATCTGTPTTFTITVNPIPTVNAVTNQTACNGAATAAVTFSGAVAGTVYNWTNNTTSIGLGASGSGNIPSFVATNTGTAPVTATITVTPSFTNGGTTCTGTPTTFTITVNPTPTVAATANQTLCNGASTTAVTFTGAVTGTVFNWTNNTTSIGLAASGSGNIASFVATNAGTAPVTATITVTPSYTNGGITCTGTPSTFTITVNPIPTVNAVTNQTVCTGASSTAITFSGGVTGTVFNWTNNTTSIGLGASGTGNIASFVATNTGTAAVTATITVTPSYTNGGATCTGTPVTFTITVNPRPTVNAVTNQSVCAGVATAAITFSGAVTGTVFNWTNNTTSIGLAASGTGNIASFVPVNTGATAVVATITVTPSFTNAGTTCTGTAVTFTITVNPQPVVTVTALSNRICLTDTLIPLSGLPVGGSWSGIGVSGFNFIPSATAVGSYTLTYTYTNAGGCSASATTVAKVENCLERERLLDDNAVIIYPNPNNGRFNIKINSTLYNYLGMKVYNMYGQLVNGNIINGVLTSTVFNGLVFGRVIQVDLTHLPAGAYIVKLYYDNGVMTAEKGFKVIIAGH